MLAETGGRFLLLSVALGQRERKGEPLMDLLLMLVAIFTVFAVACRSKKMVICGLMVFGVLVVFGTITGSIK